MLLEESRDNSSHSLKGAARPSLNYGETSSGEDENVVLEMKDIAKSFPGVKAVDDVSFVLKSGEVHTLLGENGAGKTTLMNILFGIYRQDSGEILIDGKHVKISSPHNAIAHGIGMVQQHFTLVPSFTVAENTVLGLRELGVFPRTGRVERRIRELGDTYGLKVDPDARAWTLSVGEKQRVEILKILYTGAKILILDEPTAVLVPHETRALFDALRKMKEADTSVVFISHKLDEVMQISDRITVLRKGLAVDTVDKKATTKAALAKMMVGRDLLVDVPRTDVETGSKILEVKNLRVNDDRGLTAVNDISFTVRAGEVLGIAGVEGNGQRELAECIYGMRKPLNGKVFIDGQDITRTPVRKRVQLGLSFIPQDRKGMAISPNLSVEENLFAKNYATQSVPSHPLLSNRTGVSTASRKLVRDFSIVTPSEKTRAKYLSGGNIQKVVLARELSSSPKAVIAAQPTRGLDVGAMEFVYKTLLEQKKKGAAVLLLAGDLDELFRLADRVAVIYGGKLVGYASPDSSNREKIGLMMSGASGAGDEA